MERNPTEEKTDLEARITLLTIFRADAKAVRLGKQLHLAPEASRFEKFFGDQISEAQARLEMLQAKVAKASTRKLAHAS